MKKQKSIIKIKNHPQISLQLDEENFKLVYLIRDRSVDLKNGIKIKGGTWQSSYKRTDQYDHVIPLSFDISTHEFIKSRNEWKHIPSYSRNGGYTNDNIFYKRNRKLMPLHVLQKYRAIDKNIDWNEYYIEYKNEIINYNFVNRIIRRTLFENVIFEKYSKRYDVSYNTLAISADINDIDNWTDKFFKLSRAKSFKYHWDWINDNWDDAAEFMQNNLFARQLFCQFLWYHGKLTKLAFLKKYKWIVEKTPHFYSHGKCWRYREDIKNTVSTPWDSITCNESPGPTLNKNSCSEILLPLTTKCVLGITELDNNVNPKFKYKMKKITTRNIFGIKIETEEAINFLKNKKSILPAEEFKNASNVSEFKKKFNNYIPKTNNIELFNNLFQIFSSNEFIEINFKTLTKSLEQYVKYMDMNKKSIIPYHHYTTKQLMAITNKIQVGKIKPPSTMWKNRFNNIYSTVLVKNI